jgi:hypothetical protein
MATDITEKTTEKAQGSRNSKKRKTSNEKGASSSNVAAVKSSRGRTKEKNANSKFMTEIPLDVHLEIFKLLEPVHLLHLSRVSKSLHELLTSDNMVSLWKLVCMLLFLLGQFCNVFFFS